jgi:hypothetical protein
MLNKHNSWLKLSVSYYLTIFLFRYCVVNVPCFYTLNTEAVLRYYESLLYNGPNVDLAVPW